MSAAILQLGCGGAALAAAVVWMMLAVRSVASPPKGGGVLPRTVRRLPLVAVTVLLLGRVAATVALGRASEAFAVDRVWGLALSAMLTVAALVGVATASPAAGALAGGAALAAVGELVFTLVIGAPVPLWAGIAVVVAVLAGTAAWANATLHRGRRPLALTAVVGTLAVTAAVTVGWVGTTVPGSLADEGFQAHEHGTTQAREEQGTPVVELVGDVDAAAPRVSVRLIAKQDKISLASGETLSAWTFGELGGPAITATVGDVLDVRLDNVDIAGGVTAHWHGYPVPAASDGVAGVTQDAVVPGASFQTAFALDRAGTYWYHTHQVGSEGVARGLYGTLVVLPAEGSAEDVDVVLPLHTFGRAVVFGADTHAQHTPAAPGQTVRARIVNTDQLPQRFTVSGAVFRVLAIDGAPVETDELEDVAIEIPAGGRFDLGFTMGGSAVAVRPEASRSAAIVFGQASDEAPLSTSPARTFDPLTEVIGSTPPDESAAALIAAAASSGRFDAEATYVLDRLPRLVNGIPQYAYTVNGAAYPHIPSTVVAEGDVVRLTVVNRGFETHPMHPHGHTVRVLSVDGQPPAAPLWLDTFDVGPGQVWEVAFVADNPGIWMDHCHNLQHAALGMVLHIAYRGITTPFMRGGHASNAPE
ncbi:multicopper oxidase family protein [Microbacterium pumilum]|uniref:Multicopper oxidase family protein n=1 Tax=Microbacterium pumilum TaxID=344165 RepID=A0ABP5DDQ0_9MICO